MCLAMAVSLTACGGSQNSETGEEKQGVTEMVSTEADTALQADAYEVEIENFNRTTVYKEMPQRIVSLSYSETEILAALGLEDKIVGIAEADNTVDECAEQYREVIADLPVIASSAEGGRKDV